MTPQALRKFRAGLPDCELAVYADLGSRTVLGADGALRYPQEYLDALCLGAAMLFETAAAAADPADHVFVLGPTGSRGFFRNPDAPNEALCCICRPDADAARLIRAAHAVLRGEGAGDE